MPALCSETCDKAVRFLALPVHRASFPKVCDAASREQSCTGVDAWQRVWASMASCLRRELSRMIEHDIRENE